MRKTTKISIVSLLGLFVFFSLVIPCLAQTITLGQGQGLPGSTINLNLDLSDTDLVAGFNLDIQYDINVLENPSASIDSALTAAGKDLSTSMPQAGVFRLVAAGVNQNIISAGRVATVSFQIKSNASMGATQLVLANLAASDVNAQSINISGSNGSIEVVSSDTIPPTRSDGSPTGVLPLGTTQTTISLITNENATCKYSITAGTAFASMPNTFSTTGGTSHSTIVTGLTDGNTHNYYIRCHDTAGNANIDDYSISFSIASSPANHLPIGFIDSANQEYIVGWAYDENADSNPINVHIYIDGQPTANITANLERQDLVNAGVCPDPYHGFSWAPTGLLPGEYTVNVYAINQPEGDNPELGSSPQTFTVVSTGAYCGDGTCDSNETCSDCSQDCGVCLPLPQFTGVSVLTADDTDKIYLIVNNQKRWITNEEVFLSYGLVSGSQKTVSNAELDQYSLGPDINQPSLPEGNLIRAKNGHKVYIIKPPYKRHIFNPAVFNMYQHFSWDSIREVDESVVNSYLTSDIYRSADDYRVYSLEEIDEVNGIAKKHHLNVTAQQFIDKGYKWEQVFTVNQEEKDYYETGEDLE